VFLGDNSERDNKTIPVNAGNKNWGKTPASVRRNYCVSVPPRKVEILSRLSSIEIPQVRWH